MDIVFDQEIYYSNKQHLPLGEVAKSLLALEKATAIAPRAIELLYKDVIAHDFEIIIDELHSGSLTEKLKYYLKPVFQKQLEDATWIDIETLEGKTPEVKEKIVALIFIAVVLFALYEAKQRFFPNSPTNHIEQQINVTLQAGRDISGIDEETLRKALTQAVQEDQDAIKGAVGFVKPAKRDPDASIQIDGKPYLSSQAIAEIPSTLPDEDLRERAIDLANTTISIRATDKDSGKKGWAATIPEFMDRRIRIHISPDIDLNYLAHHDVVVGNVTVFYSTDDAGRIMKPHAHLFSIDKGETASLINKDNL